MLAAAGRAVAAAAAAQPQPVASCQAVALAVALARALASGAVTGAFACAAVAQPFPRTLSGEPASRALPVAPGRALALPRRPAAAAGALALPRTRARAPLPSGGGVAVALPAAEGGRGAAVAGESWRRSQRRRALAAGTPRGRCGRRHAVAGTGETCLCCC